MACRFRLSGRAQHAEHAGLVLAYCHEGDDARAKAATQHLASQALGRAHRVYELAYRRYVRDLGAARHASLAVQWRLVIGLGNENALEAGLTLHRTYGTPLIPGSALKGVTAHYCHEIWGAADPDYRAGGRYHTLMFGATQDAGHITFHDAWIEPPSLATALVPDTLTPHHAEYYTKGKAPTDFDDPMPVPFLSIRGMFYLAVECDGEGEESRKWAELALSLVKEALQNWGVGGKTNSGYGRMR